jgi:glycosyltransferase involved in cell wall biosynthesis
LKILFIHTRYHHKGGEDTVVSQELKLLQKNNNVEVLYFQNLGGWRGALQFLKSIWNIKSSNIVKEKILAFQPEIIHIHNWHFALGPLVFREINRLGIPVVHTIHNYRLLCPSAILLYKGQLFTESLRQTFPWKAVRKKMYRSSVLQTFWLAFIVWFHKKIGTWKKIDLYVCLTHFAIELFQQSNFGIQKEQFSVKPNFTRESDNLQSIERESHFLFIGRLSEEKGIEILLNSFKELPFELKIAGDGPLKNKVIQITKEFSNISYLGNLTNTEVATALQKTQGLIFPSVWYEGMPMTILESFSTGTPVIASNLGAMSSLIIDGFNGFHFATGHVNDLKETLLKFNALSTNEKKQMGANAFENYQTTYSHKLQQGYFDVIYNKVLKNNND